ncbi:hypothetical protein AMTRI_Chr04g179840 [Amborella trichopoda]
MSYFVGLRSHATFLFCKNFRREYTCKKKIRTELAPTDLHSYIAGKVSSLTNSETLGNLLYTYYSVWFLVPSPTLLIAMIGAIVLTMHRTTKVQRQNVFRRNAIDQWNLNLYKQKRCHVY